MFTTTEVIAGAVRYVMHERSFNYYSGLEGLRARYDGAMSTQPTVTVKGKVVPRPLTIRETIECAVQNYETLLRADGSTRTKEERLMLFGSQFDTCSAIVYEKIPSEKFKIVSLPSQLTELEKAVGPCVFVDYAAVAGVELSFTQGKYNSFFGLTKGEVDVHPGWKAVVGDAALLTTFRDIVFAEGKTDRAMKFCVRGPVRESQLHPLYLNWLQEKSNIGDVDMNCGVGFLERGKV